MSLRIIAGLYKNRALFAPKGEATRPTTGATRETLFNLLMQEIEGKEFLDLFAGTGAVSIEALSRGASHATLVEKDRAACEAIKKNIEKLALTPEQITFFSGEALRIAKKLEKEGKSFDLVFLDPPYNGTEHLPIFELIDTGSLLKPGGLLIIERRGKFAFKELPTPKTLIHKQTRDAGPATLFFFTKPKV